MVKMKDCQFYVNKDKRTVTCIYYNDNPAAPWGFCSHSKYKNLANYDIPDMQRRYVGIARCCPTDKWNEDIGKLVAYSHMKNSYFKEFFKIVNDFFHETEDDLDRLLQDGNRLGDKFNHELTRLDELIKKKVEENK